MDTGVKKQGELERCQEIGFVVQNFDTAVTNYRMHRRVVIGGWSNLIHGTHHRL